MNIKKVISMLERGGFFQWVPTRVFLKSKYKRLLGVDLHLDDPETFNEKLQWLKVYYAQNLNYMYTTMADKVLAKNYVAEKIGAEHIIPTLGVWDSFDDIDFDKLPQQFVLKTNHDSGGVVVVRDKNKLDKKAAKHKLEKSLHRSFYWYGREPQYKDIKPKLFAESYMQDSKSEELRDYKFYCFNGKPEFLYVSEGMEKHSTARVSFLTVNEWKPASFGRTDYKRFDSLPTPPKRLEEMVELARTLSKDIPFLRVDLYEIEGNVYFGELTFFPCSGFMPFDPVEADKEVGKMLILPSQNKKEG